ncbi:hypothetical protein [Brevundimonas sp.]|uniref:hypothetical protein n=1 Tax=Brevundimonas sp. TaxID=1871086 RepID=UPI002AC946F9|nr:hypothetical protein [Brevundimonas sp.]
MLSLSSTLVAGGALAQQPAVSSLSQHGWDHGMAPLSRSHFQYGAGPGSASFLSHGGGIGSLNYMLHSSGPFSFAHFKGTNEPGSAAYWRHGNGSGSSAYWRGGDGCLSQAGWEHDADPANCGTDGQAQHLVILLCLADLLDIDPCEAIENVARQSPHWPVVEQLRTDVAAWMAGE